MRNNTICEWVLLAVALSCLSASGQITISNAVLSGIATPGVGQTNWPASAITNATWQAGTASLTNLSNSNGSALTNVPYSGLTNTDSGQNWQINGLTPFGPGIIRSMAAGYHAAYALTNGTDNTALGWEALLSATNSIGQTAIGRHSLCYNMSDDNVAVGADAMGYALGPDNVALGYQAMHRATGASNSSWNVVVGSQAMAGSTNGYLNNTVMIGRRAGYKATNTLRNQAETVGIGDSAFYNGFGPYNVGVGDQIGYNMVDGIGNTMLGAFSGKNTTGDYNILIGGSVDAPIAAGNNQLNIGNLIYGTGVQTVSGTVTSNAVSGGTVTIAALTTTVSNLVSKATITGNGSGLTNVPLSGLTNTDSGQNWQINGIAPFGAGIVRSTAAGYHAANALTNGSDNTVYGWEALLSATNAASQTAYGRHALCYNVSDDNVAMGADAMGYAMGPDNVALGYQALHRMAGVSNSSFNVVIGSQAMSGSTNANLNNSVIIGRRAGWKATNTTRNQQETVGIGDSVFYNGFGYYNVGVGDQVGYNMVDGIGNTMIGAFTGKNTTGNYNILIGGGIDSLIGNGNNQLNIGNLIYGTEVQTVTGTVTSNAVTGNLILAPNGTTTVSNLTSSGTGIFTNGFAPGVLTFATLPANPVPGQTCWASDVVTSRGTGDLVMYNGSNWITRENVVATSSISSFLLNAYSAGLISRNSLSDMRFEMLCGSSLADIGISFTSANNGASSYASTIGCGWNYLTLPTSSNASSISYSGPRTPDSTNYMFVGASIYPSALSTTAENFYVWTGIGSAQSAYPTYGAFFLADPCTNKITSASIYNSTATNNYICVTCQNSSYTFADSGLPIAITAATAPILEVSLEGTRCVFYTNGMPCATNTSNLPTNNTILYYEPVNAVKTAGTTTRNVYYRQIGTYFRFGAAQQSK